MHIYQKIGIITVLLIIPLTLLLKYEVKKIRMEEQLSSFVKSDKIKNNTIIALALQRYWVATVYDPILALPGTDTHFLESSINNVQNSITSYLHFYTKKDQEKIQKFLFPVAFLHSLPQLEEVRRLFIANPTYKTALVYNSRLLISLKLGRRYAQKTASLFTDFSKEKIDAAFPAGVTSPLFISDTLKEIETQFITKTQIEENRLLCLKNQPFNVQKCRIDLPKDVAVSPRTHPSNGPKVLQYGRAMRSYIHNGKKGRYSITDTPTLELPLIALDKSKCTNSGRGTYIFTWRYSRMDKGKYLYTTPVDEILFHNLKMNLGGLDSILLKTGEQYEYQPLNPYLCADSTFDIGKVRSVYFIQNYIRKNPIASALNVPSGNTTLDSLIRAERALVAQKGIVYTSSVQKYILLAQQLLYTEFPTEKLTKGEKMRLLTLITTWRAQSGWLGYEFNRISDMAATNIYVLNITHIPLTALFVTRSYYSSLLLTNNKTIFNSDITFLRDTIPIKLEKSGLVTYTNTLKRLVPLENLATFMRSQDKYSATVYRR